MNQDKDKLCPSSAFGSNGTMVFGMVGGSAEQRRVMYLKQIVPVESIDRSRLGEIAPEEIFRTAGLCAQQDCLHHDKGSSQCTLANRIVETAPPVVEQLAYCAIRPRCVWWDQHGRNACERCPQVVSMDMNPDEVIAQARIPPTPAAN
ncbi:hypothetical protein [Chromobacterium sp. IIBBL 290-4]|uniref:hypothetical protein n=1 Tax=Chromobacterium sp. IIBBL 290-4 TaxID=2953890 RepID=UPI0020B8CDBE|nr:hypothetical protein [Chromobacterium sp. IIBBL 290-4]UTH72540.1 hypothetical protein NKT35_13365 [Chromobacterium sp. IIBBL 290-4]